MRVLHGLADGDEQLQPGPDREPVPVAVVGDRHAVDQFHHEERLAGCGRAAVVHPGNVGVVHQGQRLSLGVEPSQHRAESMPILISLSATCRLTGSIAPPGRRFPFPPRRDLAQRVPSGDDLAWAGASVRATAGC